VVQTDPAPDSESKSLVAAASTWMQVVFGGLSVTIAIAGLVIAYFAWVKPHSPDENAGHSEKGRPTAPAAGVTANDVAPTPPPTPDRRTVALADQVPTVGGSNVRRSGSDLTMACASGETTDRQRAVEYDLAGRYVAMTAKLTVSKASDSDAKLQMKVFTDDLKVADVVLTKGKSADMDLPLDGKDTLRIQLICQLPNGEITLGAPNLMHT
jgi:hypothetical protein